FVVALYLILFFFNYSTTPYVYTLSLHDALPICKHLAHNLGNLLLLGKIGVFHNRRNARSRLLLLISKHLLWKTPIFPTAGFRDRSEERFSRNAETDLVCRLLLEKKKKDSWCAGI